MGDERREIGGAVRIEAEASVAKVLSTFDEMTWADASHALERVLSGAPVGGRGGRFVAALEALDPSALDDPHLFGWVHQHLGTERRLEAFSAHTKLEQKHADSVVATQIYTPRWVSDLLTVEALTGVERPTVVDPACGGGQFLLAAFDLLVGRGVGSEAALRLLHGRDLDPTAVEATRLGLRFRAMNEGMDEVRAREVVTEQIVVADGLDLRPDSYDVVLTNPPYMGHRSMPADLRARLRDELRPFHLDLATAFIRVVSRAARTSFAVLSQQNIWYLSRFESARRLLLDDFELPLFTHFGPHLFDVLKGEKASVVGFVMRRAGRVSESSDVAPTIFHDLRELGDSRAMRDAVRASSHASVRPIDEVTRLPGAPVAHWVPGPLVAAFDTAPRLGDRFDVPGSQNKTGRNREYVRSVADVQNDQLAPLDADSSGATRWRYYSKGGRYAPWWGNWDNVVDWSDDARDFYATNRTSNRLSDEWIDRPGLVYTDFGGRTFNARWKPPTALFDMAGPAIFHPDDVETELLALLVYLNSEPARRLLNALNPSLHYQVRDVRLLPLPGFDDNVRQASDLARRLVETTRAVVEAGDGGADPWGEIRRLERRANELACDAFGVPVSGDELPKHWQMQ